MEAEGRKSDSSKDAIAESFFGYQEMEFIQLNDDSFAAFVAMLDTPRWDNARLKVLLNTQPPWESSEVRQAD
jgi:uncharacterized protein (DUF1778 family)